uniref:Uncharacterized protein n=1 Tax=Panagrolaimus sp. ES5 TaxID=591445 RepID=A0AC34G486_9BILA
MADSREVDKEYLSKLEYRLNQLKDPELNQPKPEQIIKDISGRKDLQLFNLITGADLKFEDNFVDDKPIQASWLKKKAFPSTVAVSAVEIIPLVKHEQLELEQLKLEEVEKGVEENGESK